MNEPVEKREESEMIKISEEHLIFIEHLAKKLFLEMVSAGFDEPTANAYTNLRHHPSLICLFETLMVNGVKMVCLSLPKTPDMQQFNTFALLPEDVDLKDIHGNKHTPALSSTGPLN